METRESVLREGRDNQFCQEGGASVYPEGVCLSTSITNQYKFTRVGENTCIYKSKRAGRVTRITSSSVSCIA